MTQISQAQLNDVVRSWTILCAAVDRYVAAYECDHNDRHREEDLARIRAGLPTAAEEWRDIQEQLEREDTEDE